MDFIIEHSGFIFGIVLIVLLAIIGYFADKKDNEKKVNTNKNIDEGVSNKTVESSDNFASFNELPSIDNSASGGVDTNVVSPVSDFGSTISTDISNDNSVFSNSIQNVAPVENVVAPGSGVETSNVASSSSASIGFGSSDFESLDFSLEDLEKKNFDDIAKSQVSSDDENYYYSDMDDSVSPDFNDANNIDMDNDNSEVQEIVQQDNVQEPNISDVSSIPEQVVDTNDVSDVVSEEANVSDAVSIPEPVIENDVSDAVSEEANVSDAVSISEPVIENDVSGVVSEDISIPDSVEPVVESDLTNSETDDHLFDNETSNSFNDDSVAFKFGNDDGGQQSVPELFDSNHFDDLEDNDSSASIVSDESFNSSDDIWKF